MKPLSLGTQKYVWAVSALSFLVLSGCANLVSRQTPSKKLITRTALPTSVNDRPLLPSWTTKTPASDSSLYVVGESVGSADKEEALSKAWASGLVRLGMAEFPELSQVAAANVETLQGNSATRGLVLHLERVNWTGLTEVKEQGSPIVYWDESDGSYRAYRLLKWNRTQIESARAQLKKNAPHAIPLPPEMLVDEEQKIVEAVSEVQRINARNQWKEKLYTKVFGQLKCGATIADLIKVLGAPDRFNPYNRVVMEKEYYWGDYRVERQGADPRITAVVIQQNGREKKKSCP